MEVTLSASALVKSVYNALLWCPKKEPWNIGYVTITTGRVTILTTDSYAVAEVMTPVESHQGDPFRVVKITRDDLKALEDRAGKAKGLIVLRITESGLIYSDENEGEDLEFEDLYEEGFDEESWDDINIVTLSEILQDRMEQPEGHKFMTKREYWRKISMTKVDNPDVCADIWVDHEEPVLIQVGRARIAINTIDRSQNAKALGEDNQW